MTSNNDQGHRMGARITCHRCDHPLQAADGYDGQFLCCPKCGSYTSLPGAETAAGYDCAERFKSCPHCDKELPARAVLCVRCGYNLKTGRRVNAGPICKPFFRRWDGNIPLRLAVAGALLLLCAPALLLENKAGAAAGLFAWAGFLLVSAGTFPAASLRRDRRGRCTLQTTQWVCFIPLVRRTRLLDRLLMRVEADHEGGGLAAWAELLLGDWYRLRIVLVPAVALLYLYAMLAVGRYALTLADDRGSHVERTTIYRCRSEDTMREIADTLCEVAGLSYS